ncbi:putative Dynamin superfamily [Helianthus debilis subsp. tardiflorus]
MQREGLELTVFFSPKVHFSLKELVRKSIAETETVELKRFPSLKADIASAANEALEKFRDESQKPTGRQI